MPKTSPPIPWRGPIEVQSDLVTPLPSSGAGRGEKGVRPGKGGQEARAALRVTQPRIQTLGRFKFSPQALCFTPTFFFLAGGGEGVVRESGMEASAARTRGDPLAKAGGSQRSPQNSSLDPGCTATFLPRLGLETETFQGVEGGAGRHHSLWLQRAARRDFRCSFQGGQASRRKPWSLVGPGCWGPWPSQQEAKACAGGRSLRGTSGAPWGPLSLPIWTL